MRVRLPMIVKLNRTAPLLGLILLLGAGASSPALAATEEEFLTACIAAAGEDNTELCTCKAEQAASLVDEEMLGFIIARMNDPQKFSEMVKAGEVPEAVIAKWPFYVRDSNAVCLAEDTAEG